MYEEIWNKRLYLLALLIAAVLVDNVFAQQMMTAGHTYLIYFKNTNHIIAAAFFLGLYLSNAIFIDNSAKNTLISDCNVQKKAFAANNSK